MTEKYTVLRDTREKPDNGWTFPASKACLGTEIATLKSGDYSIKGHEHVFAVERKGSVGEFVQNITHRDKWRAFKAELERLDCLPASFIILEFDMQAIVRYPQGSGLPWSVRRKVRVSGEFYLKRLLEIQLAFRTRVIPAGGEGRAVFLSLCKRVLERWPQSPP